MVMEFAEYGDLSKFLQSKKGAELTMNDKCKIIEDLSGALAILHRFAPKIIHRDLKSLNILVTSIDPLSVKLSDFETACFMHEFTSGRSVIDNPIWMAPELILGTRFLFFIFYFLFYYFIILLFFIFYFLLFFIFYYFFYYFLFFIIFFILLLFFIFQTKLDIQKKWTFTVWE